MIRLTLIIATLVTLGSCACKVSYEASKINQRPSSSIKINNLHSDKKAHKLNNYFTSNYKSGAFNGNVLIAQNGEIIYKKSFGFANFKNKDTLELNTAFELGSVSKQYTAAGIMLLKQKGLIDYSDSVQKFFPNFPYHGITIKMLLTHYSGLPNYIYFCDDSVKEKNCNFSYEDVFKLWNEHKPIFYYPPNKRFDYSNSGYMVLAAIIEEVSKKSFGAFMKENFFDPLGMTNTFAYHPDSTSNCNMATGYLYGKKEAEHFFLNTVMGDKGIYTTVEDMFKWDQGLYDNEIIADSILEDAFKPYITNSKRKRRHNYGFGWRIEYMPDSTKVLFHSGWWQGFQSLLIRVPKDRTTIAILKNKKNRCAFSRHYILNVLYPFNYNYEPLDDNENESDFAESTSQTAGNQKVITKVSNPQKNNLMQ